MQQGRGLRRIAAAAALAALLLPASAGAQQQPGESLPMRIAAGTFDVLVLRPLGLVVTAVGSAFLVPVVLVSLPEGPDARDEAWERFVATPGRYVFQRPIGDF